MFPISKTCPTCGSKRIALVRTDYRTSVRGRPVVVKDLERQECPVCGEVLFDRAAMKRMQSLWPGRRRKSA